MAMPPRLKVFFYAPNVTLARIAGGLPLAIAAIVVYPIIFGMARNHAGRLQMIGVAVLGALGAVILMMAMNFVFNRVYQRRRP